MPCWVRLWSLQLRQGPSTMLISDFHLPELGKFFVTKHQSMIFYHSHLSGLWGIFPAAGGCQPSLLVLALLMCHSSLCLHRMHLPCGPQCPNFLQNTGHTGIVPTLLQYDLILTWSHLQRPYFQVRSCSQLPVLGLQHVFCGDTIQPITIVL